MCSMNPDVNKMFTPPPAPPAPKTAPAIKDPFADLLITGPDGQPSRRKTGLSSLRIDRDAPSSGSSLNINS